MSPINQHQLVKLVLDQHTLVEELFSAFVASAKDPKTKEIVQALGENKKKYKARLQRLVSDSPQSNETISSEEQEIINKRTSVFKETCIDPNFQNPPINLTWLSKVAVDINHGLISYYAALNQCVRMNVQSLLFRLISDAQLDTEEIKRVAGVNAEEFLSKGKKAAG